MIHVQTLNQEQLEAFVNSDTFQLLPDLPISRHRAVSHWRNPRAAAADTLLLLAWLDGALVGYLGVLPDHYFVGNNPAQRCGWLSCLWVSERHRGKSIAKILLSKGVESMGGQLLLTEFTPVARQLYDKLGFFSALPTRTGIRLYYRLELQRLLPPRRPVFNKIKPLLRATDALGNVFIDVANRLRKQPKREAHWTYVNAITPEIQRFIAEKQATELFRREEIELNWVLQNPWVLTAPPDEYSRRYYFSSVDHLFDFICLQVYDAENTLRAFLILARRNQNLKLPCCYITPGAEALVAAVIEWHIQEWGINTFSTFHPAMVQYYQTNRTFAVYKKALERQYLATKRLAENLAGHNFDLQDGDGDCFFT